jgi:hypothetical protein
VSELSRRQLLARGLLFGGGLAVGIGLPRPRALAAAAESSQPEVLSSHEWATVDAIAARLIPTDHEPGAREAGCVNFIDKALANEDAAARPVYTAGLAGIDRVAGAQAGAAFIDLEPEAQDGVLRSVEDGQARAWPKGDPSSADFFSQIWMHTLWGFLAEPRYGGNRDFAGWRVLGYPGGRHRLGGYTPAMMAGKAPVESVWGESLPRKRNES